MLGRHLARKPERRLDRVPLDEWQLGSTLAYGAEQLMQPGVDAQEPNNARGYSDMRRRRKYARDVARSVLWSGIGVQLAVSEPFAPGPATPALH